MPFDGVSPCNNQTILRDARELISDPDHWTTRTYHYRNSDGTIGRCAIGAIAEVLGLKLRQEDASPEQYIIRPYAELLINELTWYQRLWFFRRKMNPIAMVFLFNDNEDHAQVLRLFDKAIARQEQMACVSANISRVEIKPPLDCDSNIGLFLRQLK